jgi:hypothetical protein
LKENGWIGHATCGRECSASGCHRRHLSVVWYLIIHFTVSGNQYYLYNGNKLERGFPKPLTNLGLPESLEKIDGAMVWGHNGKTYFFSGTMYWK